MTSAVQRQIVRNGNSAHVCLPREFLDFLRWSLGDAVILELTERNTIEIRPVRLEDLRHVKPAPMTLREAIAAKVG